MEANNRTCNVYRAKHIDTGEVHFFVGTYDMVSRKYYPAEPHRPKGVIGELTNIEGFDTFAEAVRHKGYVDYGIASQHAKLRYGYSRIIEGGWSKSLGGSYKPWHPQRRGRRAE